MVFSGVLIVKGIKKNELSAFLELREILASELALNDVFILNDLYEKTASLAFDEKISLKVKN